MPIATGISWEGRRQVLAVELANRDSVSSWKDFLRRLKERGLKGVEFVVSVSLMESSAQSVSLG